MKIMTLYNHSMGIVKGTRLAKPQEIDENSSIEQIDTWELLLIDRNSGDRISITFERETRDVLVRELTGGVVLAGGEFPRI